MKNGLVAGVGAALLVAIAGGAAAQEAAGEAAAWYAPKSDGDFLVRVRGIAVVPDEDLSSDDLPGANADISSAFVPELDLTYFFTPNIAAELILATTPHDVEGRGAIDGADIGDVWLLPPTLTLQYHVTQLGAWSGQPELGQIKPYFGAGVNYTIFYGEDAGQFESIDYDDAFGWALQAGVDIEMSEGIYFNLDVKKVFLETDWTLDTGAGEASGDVEINPLIVGAGIGYRF
jgi:outer membrane protein